MADLEEFKKKARAMPEAQKDEMRNPDGVFSGMTLRGARSDKTFAAVDNKQAKPQRHGLGNNYRDLK